MSHLYMDFKFYLSVFRLNGVKMIVRPFLSLLILCSVSVIPVSGQIVVTQNSNAQQLAQMLAGAGVTISNYTLTGDPRASGTFTDSSNTNLGISQGIVLANGQVASIPQPASDFASTQFTNSGDAQLSTLTSGPIYDVSILEFDITPQGNSLQFNYVFGSEEYPQFVCSPYNDVFGFFITGPNPAGGNYNSQNLATLPNSALPVCINTVNPGVPGTYMGTTWNSGNCLSLSNSNLYKNNLTPTVNPYIVYNGMTAVLTATASVVPCQTYHLKLAIADVGDRIYDSGVFLEAYSFTSTPYTSSITSQVNGGYSSTYRGCVNGSYTVSISAAQSTNTTINLLVSGTATNGVDYPAIPSSVVIPAGQTSVTIPMDPVQNSNAPSSETAIVSIVSACAGTVIDSAILTIMNDPVPTVTVNDSTLCYGSSAQLSATGGTTYAWSPVSGLSNASISNPVATPSSSTTYTVSATWGTCTKVLKQLINVSNPQLSVSVPNDTSCNGGAIQLTATPSNGVSPYKYLWNTASTASSISAFGTGSYSVTTTDSYGCTASSSKNVVISNIVLASAVTNVSCFGDTNGAIGVTPGGPNPPYTFNWNNGSTASALSNLLGGNYTVTVNNASGCTATATYTITQPTSALTATMDSVPVLCNGGNTGSAGVTLTGGVSPYAYAWNNTQTTPTINNLTAGSYSVTVTDFGGCTVTKTVSLTQPPAISMNETQVNNTCFGGNTGSINLSVTGGTGSYTYAWSNSQTTPGIAGLTSGNYTVTVKDANNCTMAKTITIGQPAPISVTPANTEPVCSAGTNGSINISVSGGTPGYTYLWNNQATTATISAITRGVYTVTVTDNHGCTTVATDTLNSLSGVITPAATVNNVQCFNGNSGSISLSTTGGVFPYTYNWGGGATGASRNNLSAGNYQVTVTDANSCTASDTLIITQPAAPLSVSGTTTAVACFGANTGAINLDVAGGTSPYSYNWGGGTTTQNRSNLAAGNYSVTVTDSNLCTSTYATAISQPAGPLNATFSATDVRCYGNSTGSVTVNVSGGTSPYSYNWSGGINSQNLNNIQAGNYQLTVTDANSCTTVLSVPVTQPAAALTTLPDIQNVSCNGGSNGSVTLAVTGGTIPYSYDWNNGAKTSSRSGLSPGIYAVTVTDSKGCVNTDTVSVTQPLALAIASTNKNVSCFNGTDGSIDLTINGGTPPFIYKWSSGQQSPDVQNMQPGTYTVQVVDTNGCTASFTTTITQPTAIQVNGQATNARCYNVPSGAITTSVSGGVSGYSYLWSNHSTTANLNNVLAGTYILTVTDANSCTTTFVDTIGQPPAINVNTTHTNEPCMGSASAYIVASASGGTGAIALSWSTSSSADSINGLAAGTYTLTATDANSCTVTDSVTITQPPVISFNDTHTNARCANDSDASISVNVTGGTPGYKYQWSNGSQAQDVSHLTAGTYSLTVFDANGCNATLNSIVVTQPLAITASINTTSVGCYGGSTGGATVTSTGGTFPYQFHWNNNSSADHISNVTAGNYTLTVTDANGCTQTAQATVGTVPPMVLTGASNPVVCSSAFTDIALSIANGTSPYTYEWSNGDKTQDLSHVHAGDYSVTVKDANGCETDTAFKIIDLNTFSVKAWGGGVIKLGDTVSLYSQATGSSMTTYNWSPSMGINCSGCQNTYGQPGESTLFTVAAIDTNGCEAEDTVSVEVIDDQTLFIPNAFTPNGDGHNDYFQIYGKLDAIKKIDFQVFDRWGEKVYETEDVDFKWDGVYKGDKLPVAVYVYTLTASLLDDTEHEYKGSITLLR